MFIFKSIDDKIKELGFVVIKPENKYGIYYERHIEKENFTHVVCIIYRGKIGFMLQSYDKDIFDKDYIGNICVGLTLEELKLFYKKMKKLNRKYKNFKDGN